MDHHHRHRKFPLFLYKSFRNPEYHFLLLFLNSSSHWQTGSLQDLPEMDETIPKAIPKKNYHLVHGHTLLPVLLPSVAAVIFSLVPWPLHLLTLYLVVLVLRLLVGGVAKSAGLVVFNRIGRTGLLGNILKSIWRLKMSSFEEISIKVGIIPESLWT